MSKNIELRHWYQYQSQYLTSTKKAFAFCLYANDGPMEMDADKYTYSKVANKLERDITAQRINNRSGMKVE